MIGKCALADLCYWLVLLFCCETPFYDQNIGSEVEISTIEKQRKELQLLIGELKDRDKELNDMVAVHQRQLLSWEEDRQKVLTLEERCSKLEGQQCIRQHLLCTSNRLTHSHGHARGGLSQHCTCCPGVSFHWGEEGFANTHNRTNNVN